LLIPCLYVFELGCKNTLNLSITQMEIEIEGKFSQESILGIVYRCAFSFHGRSNAIALNALGLGGRRGFPHHLPAKV
jgi:hypothetical protein